jgi:uncharacterized protein DUF6603
MSDAIISNDTLTVDNETYRSDAFAELLRILAAESLIITSAQLEYDEDGSQNFTVTGNTEILSEAVEGVELYLEFSSDSDFEFQLNCTLPSLALSTLQAMQILPTSQFTDIAEVLALQFQDVSLTFDSQKTEIYFGVLFSHGQLTLLASAGISLDKIGFEFWRSYGDNSAIFSLYSEIIIGSIPVNVEVSIPLGSTLAAQNWTIKVFSTIYLSSGLEDLLAFLDSTPLCGALGLSSFTSVIPSELKQIPNFFMDEIQILCNPLNGEIQYLTFRVQSTHTFSVADGLFSLENTGIRMTISPMAQRPCFSLSIFGTIKMSGDSYVDVSVLVPENYTQDNWVFTMSGLIDLGSVVDIEGLPINLSIAELVLPQNFLSIDTLNLNVFEIEFNPLQVTISSITLNIDFEAEFELVFGLAIQNPRLSIKIANPFNQTSLAKRQITGQISSTLVAGSINFGLSAEMDETGWSFTGQTVSDSVPIGELIGSLGEEFGIALPDFVNDIALKELAVTFSTTNEAKQQSAEQGASQQTTQQPTSSSDLLFNCEGGFTIGDQPDDKPVDMVLGIDVARSSTGSYSNKLNGRLTVGSLMFSAAFSEDMSSSSFGATYSHTGEQQRITVKEIIAAASSSIAAYIPDVLTIELKDILFAYSKTTTGAGPETKFLFGFDVGTGINLSNLPLVGHEFPPEATIGVDDLQVMVASKAFNQTLVSQLNGLLPEGVTKLPSRDLNSGVGLSAMMNFGDSPNQLDLPVANDGAASQQTTGSSTAIAGAPTTSVSSTQTSDGVKWFTLQKAFGPVSFQRVGVQYKDNAVWFLLDAGITAAGLTLNLNGLSMGSALDRFDPKFNLLGMGVNYKSGGAVEIGGTFLKKEVSSGGEKYDEYDGAVVIKAKEFTISAMGSYAELDGHPSMFVYGLMDYPIGGPPFFFVTGLAAGFGYNRKLVTPELDQVAKFPLVEEAMSNPPTPNSLVDEMNRLQAYIPPSIGDNFLAFGIKFTSFKIIDSFALLTVTFGKRLEVDVLGLSTLIVPTPETGKSVTPLAKVQMELKATYYPDDGLLAVNAQLTKDSFILSRNCHLTGGFAFYTWFTGSHAGDFVQTLGGYHPSFKVPSHYPTVPRLSFNWKVDSHLTIKGDAYYALTPSTLMAGGSLDATWKDGNIKASFNAKADFLISWKPYHYDAEISVNVGVSYKFTVDVFGSKVHKTVTADVGADVHIWGPEFSGKAHVDITIVSFDISFGSGASKKKEPIDWTTFSTSFLPEPDSMLNISVGDGLVSVPQDGENDWVINPKHFCVVTSSAIPAKEAYLSAERTKIDGDFQSSFGIAPMELKSSALSSGLFVEITRDDLAAETDFQFTPIFKNVPSALWGQTMSADLKSQSFIKQALCGFEIRPARLPAADATRDIDRSKLQYSEDVIAGAFAWADYQPFQPTTQDELSREETINRTIASAETAQVRMALMQLLGVQAEVTLAEQNLPSFLIAPLIEA